MLGALLVAGPAFAQCSPDPTTAKGTTTCTGTDTDGLTVATTDTTVVVAANATVRPGNAAAAILSQSSGATFQISGRVDGGTDKPGLFVTSEPPSTYVVTGPCDPYASASLNYSCLPTGSTQTNYPSASTRISVLAGATVTGAQGILIRREASNTNGYISATLNNAGTITGTAGPAVVTDQTSFTSLSVVNTKTGTIGGITGAVSYVTNAGVIDGGSNGALASTTSGMGVANSGRIVSSGQSTTISGTGSLYVTNAAGATIGGGATAIRTTGALSLTNAGTINGAVISTAAAGTASTIDTRAGTINGDLTLGAGDDTLRARYYTKTGKIGSITGAIDGGGGTNTIAIAVDSDTTFGKTVLPTNFQRLGIDFDKNAVATLAADFTTGTAILLSGYGTVINQAALATTGPAVSSSFYGGTNFTNQGSVAATLTDADTYTVTTGATLTNSGTITANGGSGAAAGILVNSGTIRSGSATGATVSSYSTASTNSGTIAGATTGLVLSSGRLVNSGTISGDTTGVKIGYATLINGATGTITGGTAAIASNGSGVVIANAGKITGTVNLASSSLYDSSDDVFVDDGGTVSGAIRLGGGDDQLVVDLTSDTSRPLAGAMGGVDAGAGWDTLRYRVKADASAALALSNGFEALAYEVSNGAKLALTAATPLTTTIGLVGNGAVTLNGALSITDRNLIDASIRTTDQLTGAGAGPDRKLTIINAGTLALTTTKQNYYYPPLAAIHADTADVTNSGTISVTDSGSHYYPVVAILGGKTVTNSGTITDTAGSKATGVSGFTTLNNSGTIRVDGVAAEIGYYRSATITNSGLLESRQASAVTLGGSGSILTNEATGTIKTATAIDLSNGGLIVNRGTIIGNITASGYGYGYGNAAYVADGGTLTGNLTFGSGNDVFLQTGTTTGVTGTVDGGKGNNVYGFSRKASDTVALDTRGGINFQSIYVEALGADTRVTLTAAKNFADTVYLQGDGTIVNEAAIDGAVKTKLPFSITGLGQGGKLATFVNHNTILGGVGGEIQSFSNGGTIGTTTLRTDGVSQWLDGGALAFDNSGTITVANRYGSAASLDGNGLTGLSATNSGTLDGGMQVWGRFAEQDTPTTVAITNSGTITTANDDAFWVMIGNGRGSDTPSAAASLSLVNSGTITTTDTASAAASVHFSGIAASTYAITNSGTIQATGNGRTDTYTDWNGKSHAYDTPAIALAIDAGSTTGTIVNSGIIQATGTNAVALFANGKLDLTNSGTIRGGTGTVLAADDEFVQDIASTSLAGAIQTVGTGANRIVNTGTIIGSIGLGAGDDRIENRGRIDGNVFLGAGDDTFLQRIDAVLNGIVDGGEGDDSLIVEANVDGTINGDQFVNFEHYTQTGSGKVSYAGKFKLETIGLSDSTVNVAAGQTLTSTGPVTITGGNGAETVTNAGTIAGTVDLGAGDDRVVNTGTINGAVLLGAGNDSFVEGPGSRVAGGVDGGEGDDLYTVQLAGDADHIGQRSNFERLGVEGSGTLKLKLDQNFQSVALTGAGLNVALNGFTIGRVTGSDAAETLTSDGDIAAVSLGGGNDELALGASRASGVYDGGAGTDLLHFTGSGPVTLAGTATGFERVALDGKALTITGTLGTRDAALAFGDGGNAVTLAKGGTLAGTIDLGAGNDSFRLVAGSTLRGTVSGGAGTDTATIEIADNQTLDGNTLRNFEILASEGKGTLTLTGAQRYDRVVANTDLAVAANGSLTTQTVTLGAGGRRLAIAGGFSGAVQGGAGTDTVQVSGGSEAAPVVFSRVASVEAFGMTGGFARIYGDAALGAVTLSGGRLVGQGGSTISASQINVGSNATFGSAGTVTGNVAIAGTLSPGASPGTMTVNGNVALAAGSVSLFELTPTVSDKLIVNGNVAIAPGATLRIVPQGTLRPGTSYDLITASGGITGSYTTVDKPSSVFGFLIQRADRIQLLGQFLDNPASGAQASRSIAYLNAALQVQPSTSTLFDAVPALLTASGASNAPAFARLTPEPYAAATQLGIDQALSLGDVARGQGFATTRREEVGAFTFAQGIGQWHTLGGDRAAGTAEARSSGYGFLGGIGVGDRDWSVGVFAGYLDSRQRLAALDARTRTDGFVAGLHARYAEGPIRLSASLLYDGGDAHTARALPNALTATSDYRLHNWVSDLSAGYAVAVGGEWAVTPRIGITAIRTTRDRVVEQGGAFALTVAQNHHAATFADAGAGFARADTSDTAFRPYVGFGLRAQLQGRKPEAFGGYAGAPLVLGAFGAQRAPLVGTVSAGVGYRVNDGIELFSTVEAQTGRDDHRESIATGVRLRF